MNKIENMLKFPIRKDNGIYIGTKSLVKEYTESNDSKIIILSKSTLEKEYIELKRILENKKYISVNPLEF